MYFLSSSNVRQIENAFADILEGQTVKRGEKRLKEMRQLINYEIMVSTFVSRTQIYNLRLLAVLELEKIGILKEQQSVWHLKTIYYSDSDRIAAIVLKLLTKGENIKWAGEFLQCNFENMGMVETVRLIELIFRMLDNPQKAKYSISCHFNALYDCFWKVLQLVKANYEITLLLFLCIGLFYEICLIQVIDQHLQHQRSNLMQQLDELWQRVIQECDCNIGFIPSLIKVIEQLLYNNSQTVPSHSLFSLLLKQAINQFRTNNTFRQRYLVAMLQFVMRNIVVFPSFSEVLSFVSILQQEGRVKSQRILISLKLTGQIQQDLGLNQFDSKNQQQMRRIVNGLIEQVFKNHYEQLIRLYQSEGLNEAQVYIRFLPLINGYGCDSCSNQIGRVIPSVIRSIVTQLQNYVSDCSLNSFHQKELLDCISFAEFIIKFKEKVDIQLLPHLVCLFGQVACQYPNVSSLCYSLFDHLWESLASLPLNSLADFMVLHVNNLNKNEWGHQLKNYSCFLQLADYLQKGYQYFSHATATDELMASTISAYQIMVQMLRENNSSLDFNILYLLIKLASYILANRSFFNIEEAYEKLSINYLVSLIDRYSLFSREAAKLVAAHHYVTSTLMNNWPSDSQDLQIDSKEFVFRMQMYYSELEYASPKLSMEQLLLYRKFLSVKINEFCCGSSQLKEQPNQQILELKCLISQEIFSD